MASLKQKQIVAESSILSSLLVYAWKLQLSPLTDTCWTLSFLIQARLPFPNSPGQLRADGHRWQPTGWQTGWNLCWKDVQDGGVGAHADVHEDWRSGRVLVRCHCELNHNPQVYFLGCKGLRGPNKSSWGCTESFSFSYIVHESALSSLLHVQCTIIQTNTHLSKFSPFLLKEDL